MINLYYRYRVDQTQGNREYRNTRQHKNQRIFSQKNPQPQAPQTKIEKDVKRIGEKCYIRFKPAQTTI